MSEFTPEIASEIVAQCQSEATELAGALGRAFDTEITPSVGEPVKLAMESLPEGFAGPGLVVALTIGDSGALLILPESSGLVPDWCAAPDPTGQSKLATLAQELGMIALPEQFMPDDSQVGRVEAIKIALLRSGVADDAMFLPLPLGEKPGEVLHLAWPVTKPNGALGTPPAPEKPTPPPAAPPAAAPPVQQKPQSAAPPTGRAGVIRRPATRPGGLPHYTKSLLRINVPVVVTLAQKQQSLGEILDLAPGAIIHFEKSCEEMLDLEIGGQQIATGEAVKIGDKFGLRINSIVMPDERFHSLKPTQVT